MVAALRGLNVLLSFLIEIAMLGAFGYWGYHAVQDGWLKWVAAVGVPLAVAVLWGLFLAPRAVRRAHSTLGIPATLLLFFLAALGLISAGQTPAGIIMLVLAVVNRGLVALWKQW